MDMSTFNASNQIHQLCLSFLLMLNLVPPGNPVQFSVRPQGGGKVLPGVAGEGFLAGYGGSGLGAA